MKWVECEECGGTGKIDASQECEYCNGEGRVELSRFFCRTCDGSGLVYCPETDHDQSCPDCEAGECAAAAGVAADAARDAQVKRLRKMLEEGS